MNGLKQFPRMWHSEIYKFLIIELAEQGGGRQEVQNERPQVWPRSRNYLGRKNRIPKLSESSNAQSVLKRFGMDKCNSAARPMETQAKAIPHEDPSQAPADDVPYSNAIGSVVYLMTGTRPAMGEVIGKLSQFSEHPLLEHWTTVKRVFLNISRTRDVEIVDGGRKSVTPFGYTDSDWASCSKTRKSTSGYVFMMAGGPVSWRSEKQTNSPIIL